MVDFDLELIGLPSPGEGKRILQENGLDWRAQGSKDGFK